MTMHMETMQEMTVVYIRCIGPYGTDNRDMMERLKHWARAKGLLESGVILGAAWDDPARTPPERCRYDVCLTTEGCFPELEEGMLPEWIPGGRYACFQGAHTLAGIQILWQTSFAALAEHGIAPAPGRPVLERYRSELLKQGLCELCIPI